jgi:hypothetical protein
MMIWTNTTPPASKSSENYKVSISNPQIWNIEENFMSTVALLPTKKGMKKRRFNNYKKARFSSIITMTISNLSNRIIKNNLKSTLLSSQSDLNSDHRTEFHLIAWSTQLNMHLIKMTSVANPSRTIQNPPNLKFRKLR